MEELLKKLSSYNIFNYLLPGIVFVVLTKEILGFSLYIDNIVLGVFYYYFFGLIISRVGSVLVEPLLKKLRIVSFLEYPRFLKASKADKKIETLSESNNMFRTIIALVLCLGILQLVLWVSDKIPGGKGTIIFILLGLLLLLFILAYRKQSAYITKRIVDCESAPKDSA
jgi:hypothetical protein